MLIAIEVKLSDPFVDVSIHVLRYVVLGNVVASVDVGSEGEELIIASVDAIFVVMSYAVFNKIQEGKSVTSPDDPLYVVVFSVEVRLDGSGQLVLLQLDVL